MGRWNCPDVKGREAARRAPYAMKILRRVPAVYLRLAFLPFLAAVAERRINKLRQRNMGPLFESLSLRQVI